MSLKHSPTRQAKADVVSEGPLVLISDAEVAAILGCSRATVWRRTRDRSLPEPVRLHGLTRWRRDEVHAVIGALSAGRSGYAAQK